MVLWASDCRGSDKEQRLCVKKCSSGAMGMWRCPAQDPSSPIQGRNNVTVATFGPNLETLNVIISEQLIHFSNTSSCSGRPHWRWNVFSRYLVNVPHLPDLAEAELTSCFSHIAIELFALWLHISYMTWLKMLFWFLAIDFFFFFTQVLKEINGGCY